MSWHSQVEPAIIQGDFWQVSQFFTFVTPKSGFMSSYFESLARNQF